MGVVYEPLRLVLGLGVAAVLLTVAVWLIRTTDWSAPGGDPFDEDRPGSGQPDPQTDSHQPTPS
jgi:hypothetical protein